MKLITAHRILIAAGIAFFVFYALFQARMYATRGGDLGTLAQAAISGVIAIALVLYYRSLRGWGRR